MNFYPSVLLDVFVKTYAFKLTFAHMRLMGNIVHWHSMNSVVRYALGLGLLLGGPSWVFAFSPSSPSITCPPPAVGAFTGCYYDNLTLSGDPVFVRTDSQINFDWGSQSPDRSLQPLNFSARWQGNFTFNQGNYKFSVITSDGMRIYIDGNLILNAWRNQPPNYYVFNQAISQGTHLVVVEYYELQGGATAQISWQNTSPVNTLTPVISSFTSTPAGTAPGNPVTLAWNVSGATSVSIDHGVGDVTNRSSIAVSPATTTTYTLTASNSSGSSTAGAAVTVTAGSDVQPPTIPTLVSATGISATEADLAWTASSDNVGVAGYQIIRNGSAVKSVPATALAWADTTVSASATYVYSVKAYDGAGNYSNASNSMQVTIPTTPALPGACPGPATNAFTGCYYNNMTLSGDPVFVRTDSQINFDWGSQSPDRSLQPLNFSARWQGNFTFNQGNYKFSVITSDGMRIYIDGNVILDAWRDQPPNFYTANQTMSQGNHLIVVEYYERQGGAAAQISWQNTSPVNTLAPVISSFTSTPASVAPGSPVTLAWSVSGATSVSIDHGVGDVTNRSSIAVSPAQTTTYTLTASNNSGSSTAVAAVTVTAGSDVQPPTVPTLVSATATTATEADLAWTASSDNVGVAGYQIIRNGAVVKSVPATALAWADTTVSASATYVYSVKAYDGAGNYSNASNSMQVTIPAAPALPGACPGPATNAFTGCYYNNMTLSGNPVFVRTDSQIYFDWGSHSPDPSLQPLNFSARWQGNFTFSQGNYKFSVITSDGMRIYIDGNLILDAWLDQPPDFYTVNQTMSQGSHLIAVEYYERQGGATAQITWQNTSPVNTLAPVISSFTSTPSATAPGTPVTLAWSVSGATSVSIDHGVGDVTNRSSIAVSPAQTTTYTLTASNNSGSSTAVAAVTVTTGSDVQPPTAPTLVSATAISATEVDLAWTASSDNIGVAGYQILRNGTVIASIPGSALTYADTTGIAATTYSYTVNAYDAAGNHSALSNAVQATTADGPPISVTWYGGCWYEGTVGGVTGKFQAVDFSMVTPKPVAVQGSLFFGSTCDTSLGIDNMNDFNSLTGSTHMIQGFSYHHDEMPTSALYWMGDRTPDGQCPKGAPCSGCIHYTPSTPLCSNLP